MPATLTNPPRHSSESWNLSSCRRWSGAFTILTAKAAGAERRPVWSGLVIALVIVAGTSWQIGGRHAGQPGADILMYVSPLLFGMAIMGALFAIRRRRGLDGAPPPS